MSSLAQIAASHKESTIKGTKMRKDKCAMLASKRISVLEQLGRTNTDKRCSIAASAGASSILKTIQRILQDRIATNATQSWQKAQCSQLQMNGQPRVILLLKDWIQAKLTLHNKVNNRISTAAIRLATYACKIRIWLQNRRFKMRKACFMQYKLTSLIKMNRVISIKYLHFLSV